MSQKNRNMMPQSTAGLIRYFEESEESIKLKPEHVVLIAVGVMAIVVILKFVI